MKAIRTPAIASVVLIFLFILGINMTVFATRLFVTESGTQTVKAATQPALSVKFLSSGRLEIFRGGVQIAAGVPSLQNVTPTTASGVTLSATHGQINENFAATNLAIAYDCVLSGTDLTLNVHITNNGTSPVSDLILVTPPFKFAAAPTGTMPSWHSSYIAQQGLGIFHPGYGSPIGCVYAGDKNYVVAAWSPSELPRASLIQASFASSSSLPNPMPVELHTTTTINAGASSDVSIVLRVTSDTTPAGILSGYKSLLPAMSYTPVAKPATAFQSIDASWITPTNPYGYNGASRRLDLPQGVIAYLQMVNPMLKASGGIGVIFWAPGGYQTTTMYPIDFDVNLNRISTTWPSLLKGLKSNGYRTGICARLGDTLTASGTGRRADPNNANDVATMLTRIDNTANMGVDMWYVDSVCNDWPSTQMTAIAKKHLPANHLFFTEYASDISLGFAGAYCEWLGTQTRWLTEQQRAQLLYLYPNSSWLCADRTGSTTPAQLSALGFEPLTGD
jgi:hypothetical protein